MKNDIIRIAICARRSKPTPVSLRVLLQRPYPPRLQPQRFDCDTVFRATLSAPQPRPTCLATCLPSKPAGCHRDSALRSSFSPLLHNAEMLQSDTRQKQTPGRRRNSRNPARPSGQKSYASENDMPANPTFQPDFSVGAPATPQKSSSGSPVPSPMAVNSKSAKRNGARSRPKQVSTSPGLAQPGQRTPPQTAGAKPTAATAFAGATFHASPAPSSLPIPSFFAKLMPDSPGRRDSSNVGQEPSPPASDSDVPTPRDQPSIPRATREESPLDIFFRADRAEKERARRASSANVLSGAAGPFSPPLQTQSPQENNTFPRSSDQQQSRRPAAQRNPLLGISAVELDGTPGKLMGPAFSTPYQERIRAARSSERQGQVPLRTLQQQQAVDRSEDLKRFLFGGKQPTSPEVSKVPARQTPEKTALASPPTNGPATSDPSNIRAMEDSLRQILKLDSLSLGLTNSS